MAETRSDAVTVPPLTAAGPSGRRKRSGRRRLVRSAGQVAVVLALLSGLVTFLILTGLTPISPTHNVVVSVSLVNLCFVLLLLGLISWEGWTILQARRRGRAGSRLHIQIVSLFCLVAALPAIFLALMASVTLDRGLDRWFEERTRAIIDNSLTVARAYVREHGQVIRADLLAMATDIDNAAEWAATDPARFQSLLDGQAILRALPGAHLVRTDKTVWLSAKTPRPVPYAPPVDSVLERAVDQAVVYATPSNRDVVWATVKLRRFENIYLAVSRPLDGSVLAYLRQAEAGVAEYRSLDARRYGVQLAFGLMYLGLALILLLSAIWIGIGFADRLVSPVRRLITAADRVSGGDLESTVDVNEKEGDVANLGKTFNNMIRQIRTQRDALLTANKMLDRRRRFTEAVLSGVTAGVIGIDRDGKVTLINRSAMTMIGLGQPKIIGHPLVEQVPELAGLLTKAETMSGRSAQQQVVLLRDGTERTISVRISAEQSGATEQGYVVTLDDITELLTAQRGAAWADIARRIAHEIKNPLTPIQLSAERLKRKYGRTLEADKAVFEQCTDTIIRQVGDIGRMVDEFSSFARMPKPTMETADIGDVVQESVFLMRVGHPSVEIAFAPPEAPLHALCDRRLIAQALTNIIKNASESVEARLQTVPDVPGRIEVAISRAGDHAVIDITDNGVGLPVADRAKLLEPYITHREKGTGLGLAIVRKIMEDHGGQIDLLDAPSSNGAAVRGAKIRLTLPISAAETTDVSGADRQAGEAAYGG